MRKVKDFRNPLYHLWIVVFSTYILSTNEVVSETLKNHSFCPIKPNAIKDFDRFVSEITYCTASSDCFSPSRKCYYNRCTGFAGTDERQYSCGLGMDCHLRGIPGHFDVSDEDTQYLIRIFPVKEESLCETKTLSHSRFNFSEDDTASKAVNITEYFIATQPAEYICVRLNDTSHWLQVSSSDVAHSSDVNFGVTAQCIVTDSQQSCNAMIPSSNFSATTGRYSLFGCIHHSGSAQYCATDSDFIIQLGWLNVNGLQSLGEVDGALQIPQYYCDFGTPCLLSSFTGYNLETKDHFIHLLFGLEKCSILRDWEMRDEEALKDMPAPLSFRCVPIGKENRCYIEIDTRRLYDENKLVFSNGYTLCGCNGVKGSNCNTPMLLGTLWISSFPQKELQSFRVLQSDVGDLITDAPANSIPPPEPISEGAEGVGKECLQNSDCFSGYGKCVRGVCYGFHPNLLKDAPDFYRCVDGYYCIPDTDYITGRGITSNYRVIAIHPQEECGAARNLKSNNSLFYNSNLWECETDVLGRYCSFNAGVGMRLNKNNAVEGVKLCGCPDADQDKNSVNCDTVRDFYVPIGYLTVQECLTNAHCDKSLAYCLTDHCAKFFVTALSTGWKVFDCMVNQQCTLESVTNKSIAESLKVIPIAVNFSCGADAALDPNFIEEEALPCVMDLDNDGSCDISLGVMNTLGSSRLCGCDGKDYGGNGRPCDQPEDFTLDVGFLNVGECNIDRDCAPGSTCFGGTCLADDLAPFIVSTFPANQSSSIQPVKTIVLEWNENIVWGAEGQELVVKSLTDTALYWVIALPKYTVGTTVLSAPRTSREKYELEIVGRKLKITVDTSLPTLPEGAYMVMFSYDFVRDLNGNAALGEVDIILSISNIASCPFLYATGFSVTNGNPNGLYQPSDPINGKASWRGGTDFDFYIYWKLPQSGYPGMWIVDVNLNDTYVLAYQYILDLEEAFFNRPASGLWYKGNDADFDTQNEVVFWCLNKTDTEGPILKEISPARGSTGWPVDKKLTLKFSEPINFGHWSDIRIESIYNHIDPEVMDTVAFYPDWEAGMRGNELTIPNLIQRQYTVRLAPQPIYGNVLEVHLPKPLLPGTTYQIVSSSFLVTDLAYNPFGSLDPGKFIFTTFGVGCSNLSDRPSLRLGGSNTTNGATAIISCAKGYSVLEGETHSSEVECVDGTWVGDIPPCRANCGPYPDEGNRFNIEGIEHNTKHGDSVVVSCLDPRSSDEESEVLFCNHGFWDPSTLKCRTTCGLFPSLGSNYVITSSEIPSTSYVGSSRHIRCSRPAQPQASISEQTVYCKASGWEAIELQCNINCKADFLFLMPGYVVNGSDLSHGSKREIRCMKGYNSITNSTVGTATCVDGEWKNDHAVECKVGCSDLELGAGYDVLLLKGGSAVHGTELQLSCRSNALQEAGGITEIIRCQDGFWTPKTIVCKAPCLSPGVVFGNRYLVTNLDNMPSDASEYPHGTHGTVQCMPHAISSIGVSPTSIICADGNWRAENEAPISSVGATHKDNYPINLDCKGICLFPRLNNALAPVEPISGSLTRYTYFHEDQLEIECANGFFPVEERHSTVRYKCNDGHWESDLLLCKEKCSSSGIIRELSSVYKFAAVDEQSNGFTLDISCLDGLDRLTGPRQDTYSCERGLYTSSRLLCGTSSCTDGLLNGDETGIDCGGSCERPCTNSCTDMVMNGDETGVDCGGSCGPCVSCEVSNRFSNDYAISLDNGLTYTDVKNLPTETRVSTGRIVHVQCASPLMNYQRVLRRELDVFRCQNGELEDRPIRINCSPPTCNDGVQNGDETGVDCGGGCRACPSCYDGVQNGNEAYIDCGSATCRPCLGCNPSLLKAFLLLPDKFEVIFQSDIVTGVDVNQIGHSNRMSVKCKRDGSLLHVDCLDGAWMPFGYNYAMRNPPEYLVDKFRLECVTEDRSLYPWDYKELLLFTVPRFTHPVDSCARQLLINFESTLLVECGTFIYSGLSKRVEQFCTGGCYQSLRQQLMEDASCSDEEGDLVRTVSGIISRIVDIYCAKRNDEYCFASGGDTMDSFRNLHTHLAESPLVLQSACPAPSCFRSNIQYILALLELAHYVRVNEVGPFDRGMSDRRRLQESEVTSDPRVDFYDEPPFIAYSNLRDASSVPQRPSDKFLGRVGFGAPEAISVSDSKHRRLQGTQKTATVSTRSGTMAFLRSVKNVERILDLMCLQVRDRYCASHLMRLGVSLPIPDMSPSMDVAQMSHPCSEAMVSNDNCALQIYRHLGEAIYDAAVVQPLPNVYDMALGKILKVYGRTYCQLAYNELYCGDVLFGSSNHTHSLMKPMFPPYQPSYAYEYPRCNCPIEFIGDGQCDLECFNADCGYDGYDCLYINMFASIFDNLLLQFPLDDGCNPFDGLFLNNMDSGCCDKIKRAIVDKGCCTSTLLELLSMFLQEDSSHPLVKTNQTHLSRFLTTQRSVVEEDIYSLELDRSVFWFEQMCQVSLDRTCSRGLRHPIVSFGFSLANLDYYKLHELDADFTDETLSTALGKTLRHFVSHLLKVPVADVTEYRNWPGSVNVELVLDSGWLLNVESFLKVMDEIVNDTVIEADISDFLSEGSHRYYNDVALPKVFNLDEAKEPTLAPVSVKGGSIFYNLKHIQLRHASVATSPLTPNAGTFGMGRLESTLSHPSCGEDLGLDVPSDVEFQEAYLTFFHGFIHGASAEVHCGETYSAKVGESPQTLQCDQGRWIPSNGPKIVCRRLCGSYLEFDEEVLKTPYFYSGMGNEDGHTRSIGCSSGYTAVERGSRDAVGSYTPAPLQTITIVCQNGEWSERTIECVNSQLVKLSESNAKCVSVLQQLGKGYHFSELNLDNYEWLKEEEWVFRLRCSLGYSIPESPLESGEDSSMEGLEVLKEPYNSVEVLCGSGDIYLIGSSFVSGNQMGTNEMVGSTLFEDRESFVLLDFSKDSKPLARILPCEPEEYQPPPVNEKPISDAVWIGAVFAIMFSVLTLAGVSVWVYKKYISMNKKIVRFRLDEHSTIGDNSLEDHHSNAGSGSGNVRSLLGSRVLDEAHGDASAVVPYVAYPEGYSGQASLTIDYTPSHYRSYYDETQLSGNEEIHIEEAESYEFEMEAERIKAPFATEPALSFSEADEIVYSSQPANFGPTSEWEASQNFDRHNLFGDSRKSYERDSGGKPESRIEPNASDMAISCNLYLRQPPSDPSLMAASVSPFSKAPVPQKRLQVPVHRRRMQRDSAEDEGAFDYWSEERDSLRYKPMSRAYEASNAPISNASHATKVTYASDPSAVFFANKQKRGVVNSKKSFPEHERATHRYEPEAEEESVYPSILSHPPSSHCSAYKDAKGVDMPKNLPYVDPLTIVQSIPSLLGSHSSQDTIKTSAKLASVANPPLEQRNQKSSVSGKSPSFEVNEPIREANQRDCRIKDVASISSTSSQSVSSSVGSQKAHSATSSASASMDPSLMRLPSKPHKTKKRSPLPSTAPLKNIEHSFLASEPRRREEPLNRQFVERAGVTADEFEHSKYSQHNMDHNPNASHLEHSLHPFMHTQQRPRSGAPYDEDEVYIGLQPNAATNSGIESNRLKARQKAGLRDTHQDRVTYNASMMPIAPHTDQKLNPKGGAQPPPGALFKEDRSMLKSFTSYGDDDELYPDDSASCVANDHAYLYAMQQMNRQRRSNLIDNTMFRVKRNL